MSIIYCRRCDNDFDSDTHTEPLCRHCMAQITTEYVYPPIPIRDMDWTAVFSDTYDGAEDAGPMARMIGTGRTEDEAIRNLVEAL